MGNSDDFMQEFMRAGSDIMRSVNRALESGDFEHLGEEINRSVQRATQSKNRGAARDSGILQDGDEAGGQGYGGGPRRPRDWNAGPGDRRRTGSAHRQADADMWNTRDAGGWTHRDTKRTSDWGAPWRHRTSGEVVWEQEQDGSGHVRDPWSREGEDAAAWRPQDNKSRALTPFTRFRVSRTRGLGRVVGGATGGALFGFIAFGLLLGGLVTFNGGLLLAGLVTGGIAVACVASFNKGKRQARLTNLFYKYARVVGNRTWIEVRELSSRLRIPAEQVRADLQGMIADGLLPEGHMDRQQTTLMLTDEVYEQYLSLRDSGQAQRDGAGKRGRAPQGDAAGDIYRSASWTNEAAREGADTADSAADVARASQQAASEANLTEEQKEAARVIREGKVYIQKVHAANDAIPGDEMSAKLDRLENILKKIFVMVEKQPAKAGDMRRLMEYYLPTTDKLLNAYMDLDAQPAAGQNITDTKKKIEDSMDMINTAFEKLLDSLYQDMSWDVSSDISVMETMLKQDGLTGEDFKH